MSEYLTPVITTRGAHNNSGGIRIIKRSTGLASLYAYIHCLYAYPTLGRHKKESGVIPYFSGARELISDGRFSKVWSINWIFFKL